MLFVNATVLTNDKDNNFYTDGAVYVKDNIIEAVGPREELEKKYSDAEKIDVEGKLIMPGMICAHTHIYSTYARGMSVSKPTDNFFNVLANQWWALDRELTLEDVKVNALTMMIESAELGVTSVIDHHAGPNSAEGSLFAIGEAAKEIGMRVSLSHEVSDRDGEEITDRQIKENVDWIKHCLKEDDDMIHGLFGMHAAFTMSNETLEKSANAMAGVYDGYHVHVAEGIEDQWDSLKKYGKRVGERLEDFGIFSENTLAIHGVHVNEREMDILKHHNTPLIFNPMSNMNNAIGCPPILRMMEKGLTVGMGTDAFGHDMFEAMKVSNILLSHNAVDPTRGFGETIEIQMKNNPKIMSHYLKRQVGVIEEGAYADIIVLDYADPITPFTADNWAGHVLFGLTGRLVTDTMINGKFVMRNKEIKTVDKAKIHAQSRQGAQRVWPNL